MEQTVTQLSPRVLQYTTAHLEHLRPRHTGSDDVQVEQAVTQLSPRVLQYTTAHLEHLRPRHTGSDDVQVEQAVTQLSPGSYSTPQLTCST